MSALWALVRRDARDARFSLVAVPLVSAAVLAVIHAAFPSPFAAAQAAAMAMVVLIPLWTLYFAADSFATDCASGRMATKALLPVSAMTLWSSKLVLVILAIAATSIAIVGCELGIQRFGGAPDYPGVFALDRLVLPPLVALLAAIAVLCSLLVENALVAMLLSLIVAAMLAGLGWLFSRALGLAGIEWSGAQWSAASTVLATVVLGASALAFARGQRKLGRRSVRVGVALSVLGAFGVAGGVAAATAIHGRASSGLEDPRTRFHHASASPDGRFLALEVEAYAGRNVEGPCVVWMIDLETKSRELVAWPGMLVPDFHALVPMPWDGARNLRVIGLEKLGWRDLDSMLRVDARDDGIEISALDDELPRDSRLIPAWAEIETKWTAEHRRAVTVRVRDGSAEKSFAGDMRSTAIGRSLFLSPEPGGMLVLRDGQLSMLELSSGAERVLYADGVKSVDASPDGSALLVRTEDATVAVSSAGGTPLHESWSHARSCVQWIEGDGRTRAVRISPIGVAGPEQVLDLDTRVGFELRVNRNHWLLHQLGEHGYVYVDADDDLVWVDPRGERIEVLVDR
jgi:hypothetical protein